MHMHCSVSLSGHLVTTADTPPAGMVVPAWFQRLSLPAPTCGVEIHTRGGRQCRVSAAELSPVMPGEKTGFLWKTWHTENCRSLLCHGKRTAWEESLQEEGTAKENPNEFHRPGPRNDGNRIPHHFWITWTNKFLFCFSEIDWGFRRLATRSWKTIGLNSVIFPCFPLSTPSLYTFLLCVISPNPPTDVEFNCTNLY